MVAEVAGEQFTASEAFQSVLFHFRDDGIEILRKFAGDAIIRAEASRLGITVSSDEVEPAVREAVESLQKRVETEYGTALTLDEFLHEQMFTSRAAYESAVRAFARQTRLTALVIRYDQLTQDRLTVRHLLVRDRARASQCLQKLREGADFAALAREESLAPTKADGGKLPPFDREFAHPITEPAFATATGTLGAIVEEKRGDQTWFHLFKVIERTNARKVIFAEVRDELVRGLVERPLSRFEFESYMRKAGRRYPATILGRPLTADSRPAATAR